MANHYERFTSNSPAVSDIDDLKEVLAEWRFSHPARDVSAEVSHGELRLCGQCGFIPHRKSEIDHPDERFDMQDNEGFLKSIEPFLEEDLIIHQIGHAKIRYPFNASLYMVNAETGETKVEHIHERQQAFLSEDNAD